MSTGDIIESMNNRPQNLGFIEEAPQIKEAIYVGTAAAISVSITHGLIVPDP